MADRVATVDAVQRVTATRQRLGTLVLVVCGLLSAPLLAQESIDPVAEVQASQGPADPGSANAASTPADELVARELGDAERGDTQIASRVAAKLARQEGLAGVAVEVNAGVVTLSGTVLDEEQRELATSLARSVAGVVAVDDEMELSASLRERLAPALEQAQEKLFRLLGALPLLLVAVALVLLFAWFGRLLARHLHLLRWGSRNPYLDGLLRQAVRLALLLVGLLVALDLLGATALVGAVLGSAGVLGIMLGFAFKDLAENHLAGVMLSLRRPFEPGDHIVVDGHEGKVISLNSRATVLMTLDGNHLRLPNAMVFKGVLLNYTRNPMRRMQFSLGVGTAEDLTEARRLAIATLRSMSAIAAEPEPQATIMSVGESSVAMDFHAWLDQREVDFLKTRSEAIRRVKQALEEAGMDLPEPIYRVHLLEPSQRPEDADAEPGARPAVGKKPAAPQPPHGNAQDGVDVSVDHAINRQIEHERATGEGQDLLQHPAPKE